MTDKNESRFWMAVEVVRGVAILAAVAVVTVYIVRPRHIAHASPRVLSASVCIDPAAFGAVPGDGLSDRPAIQAALDAAAVTATSTVCLGAGTWDLDRAPIGSYNRFATLATHGQDVTLTGAGPSTVLRVSGDQGGTALFVIAIDPSARNVAIRSLAIDTSQATHTDEQTHAVAVTSTCGGSTCQPIDGLLVEDVTFRHPASTDGSRKGDCIRLLGGSPAMPTSHVTIQHNDLSDCARSAIELQRGLHDVTIRGNAINCVTCDQAIDGEASGGTPGSNENTGLEITDNTIVSGPSTQGDYDITVTGSGDPYRTVHIHGNRLTRGIRLYRTADVEIDHEVIALTARTGDGVIDASNTCSGLFLHDMLLERHGLAGPMLRLTPHSGAVCRDAVIQRSVLTQGTAGSGVAMESASGVTLAGLSMAWLVPSPLPAITVRSTIAVTTGLTVVGTSISGPVATGIRLDAAPLAIMATTLGGDAMVGVGTALACTGTGPIAPIVMADNSFGAGPCPRAP